MTWGAVLYFGTHDWFLSCGLYEVVYEGRQVVLFDESRHTPEPNSPGRKYRALLLDPVRRAQLLMKEGQEGLEDKGGESGGGGGGQWVTKLWSTRAEEGESHTCCSCSPNLGRCIFLESTPIRSPRRPRPPPPHRCPRHPLLAFSVHPV